MLRPIALILLLASFVSLWAPRLEAAEYRLRPGDAVNVSVLGHPEWSVSAQPIRPDGRISLPLVPEVQLEGRTVAEATETLSRAYLPYLRQPQVVLSVARLRPLRITVLGQVGRPGTVDFPETPTLLEVLASAGGLTERADRGNVRVLWAGETRRFDVERHLSGIEQAPKLADGAVVEVGELWGPDFYRLVPLLATVVTTAVLLYRER